MSPDPPRDPAEQPTRAALPRTPNRPRQPPIDPSLPGRRIPPPGNDVLAEVRSLRVIAAGVGLLALLALVVGFIALSKAGDDGGSTTTSGASPEQVSRLNDRVDRLSRQVQSARAAARDTGDLDAVRKDVEAAAKASDLKALQDKVDGLTSDQAAGGDAGGGDQQAAIEDLGARVDDLQSKVDELQSQQQTAP